MPSPNTSFGENVPFKNDGLKASRSRFLRALNLFPDETTVEGEGQGLRAEPWLRESQEMLVMDGIDLPEFEDLDELPTLDSAEEPDDSATGELPDDPDQLWFDETVTTLFMEDADKPIGETALVKPITQTAAWPVGARAKEIAPVIALGEADVEAEAEADVEAKAEADVEAKAEADVEAEAEADGEVEAEADGEAEAEAGASPKPLDDVPAPPVVPPIAGMEEPMAPVGGGHRDTGIKLAPGWKPLRGKTAKPAELTGSDEKVAATLRPPRQDSILDGFGQFLEDTVVLNAAIDGPDFKALAPPFDTPEESTAPSAKMTLAESPTAKGDVASWSDDGDSAEPPQPPPETPAALMATPLPVKPERLGGEGDDSALPAAESQAEDASFAGASADSILDPVVEDELKSTWAEDSSSGDSDDLADDEAEATMGASVEEEDEAGTGETEAGGVDQIAAETPVQPAHASKIPEPADSETPVPEVIDLSTKVPRSVLAGALPSAGEKTLEADLSDAAPAQGSQPIPAPSLVEKTQLRGFDASLLYGTSSGDSFFDDLEKTPDPEAETPLSESGGPEETVATQEDPDPPVATPLPSASLLQSEPEIKEEEPMTEPASEFAEEVEIEAKASNDSDYMASLMPRGDGDSGRSGDSSLAEPVAEEAIAEEAIAEEAIAEEAMAEEAMADVDSANAIPRPDDEIPVSALGYAFSKVNPAVLPHGVRCPACGVDLQIQARYLGIEGKCPACAEMIIARKKGTLEPIADLADGRAPRYARQPELEPVDVPGGTTLAGKSPLDSAASPQTPSGDPFSNPNSTLRKAREAAARGVWGPSSGKGLS